MAWTGRLAARSLNEGNLLARDGRLCAVIDFGTMAIGDPACDLMVAWTLLTSDTRELFRTVLPFDDATWVRGRGWALSWALIVLPYYKDTNPGLCRIANYTINEILGRERSSRWRSDRALRNAGTAPDHSSSAAWT